MKLIDKEKIVAEIKGYIFNYKEIVAKTNRNDSTWVDSVSMIDAKIDLLQHLLFFLDTLEVKEVDLEKEIKDYFDSQPIITRSKGVDYRLIPTGVDIARHFFELGIKAHKGE